MAIFKLGYSIVADTIDEAHEKFVQIAALGLVPTEVVLRTTPIASTAGQPEQLDAPKAKTNTNQRWTNKDMDTLLEHLDTGMPDKSLARMMDRTGPAITTMKSVVRMIQKTGKFAPDTGNTVKKWAYDQGFVKDITTPLNPVLKEGVLKL